MLSLSAPHSKRVICLCDYDSLQILNKNILNHPKIHHPIGVDPEGVKAPLCLKCRLNLHLPNTLNKVHLEQKLPIN